MCGCSMIHLSLTRESLVTVAIVQIPTLTRGKDTLQYQQLGARLDLRRWDRHISVLLLLMSI